MIPGRARVRFQGFAFLIWDLGKSAEKELALRVGRTPKGRKPHADTAYTGLIGRNVVHTADRATGRPMAGCYKTASGPSRDWCGVHTQQSRGRSFAREPPDRS